MKFIVLDLETTGADTENDKILQFSAIAEDTRNIKPLEELPVFNCYVRHDEYNFSSPVAEKMNRHIVEAIQTNTAPCPVYSEEEVVVHFFNWLVKLGFVPNYKNGIIKITLGGKNVDTFDMKFLVRLPNWISLIYMRLRVLDPAILYTNINDDEELPDLTECLKRAGLSSFVVLHEGISDSMMTLKLLRLKYPILNQCYGLPVEITNDEILLNQ